VPDAGRARERAGQAGHRLERASELALPGDVLLPPQAAQQLVLLRELVPLLTGCDAEHGELAHLIALADHQLDASARELVDRGVILGQEGAGVPLADGHGVEPELLGLTGSGNKFVRILIMTLISVVSGGGHDHPGSGG
jgi:hypothetical protein